MENRKPCPGCGRKVCKHRLPIGGPNVFRLGEDIIDLDYDERRKHGGLLVVLSESHSVEITGRGTKDAKAYSAISGANDCACGSHDLYLQQREGELYWVRCTVCEADGAPATDEHAAIEAWNQGT